MCKSGSHSPVALGSRIQGRQIPQHMKNLGCQQLGIEAQSVLARAATLSGAQDDKRTRDQVATGVAIVVFWPAAFFVGGDSQVAAELAQMKGQLVLSSRYLFRRTAEFVSNTDRRSKRQSPNGNSSVFPLCGNARCIRR
jgi:hypothetical protein